MKRKLLSILFALVLVLTLTLVSAGAALADDPNTVASSTMIFQGSLTDDSDGSYTGTIWMVDENAESLGDNIAGFDVYAKNGAIAFYDKDGSGSEDYEYGAVVGNDAYDTAGGWGSFWDPDVADYNHYQLKLDGDTWALEYNGGSGAVAAPMSGTIDWAAMYALETGTGEYYVDPGSTAENHGKALSGDYGSTGNPVGAWEMDWSWGSEFIPLQFPGFDVTIEEPTSGIYRVTMVPAAAGSTLLTVDVPDITAISVNPTSIDFGTLVPGQLSSTYNIVVSNVGTNPADVDVDVTGDAIFTDYLQLRHSSGTPGWTATDPWLDIITDLALNSSQTVQTRLPVPGDYTPLEVQNGQLEFTATASL